MLSPNVESFFTRHFRLLIPRRRQSVSGHVQKVEQGVHLLCELHDVEGPVVLRDRVWTFSSGRPNRPSDRIKGFDFVDQSTEIGKVGNTIAFEIALPLHDPDDLTNNLCQPSQGVSAGKREGAALLQLRLRHNLSIR